MTDNKLPRKQSFAGRSPEDVVLKKKGIARRYQVHHNDSGSEESRVLAEKFDSDEPLEIEVLVAASAHSVGLQQRAVYVEKGRTGGEVRGKKFEKGDAVMRALAEDERRAQPRLTKTAIARRLYSRISEIREDHPEASFRKSADQIRKISLKKLSS